MNLKSLLPLAFVIVIPAAFYLSWNRHHLAAWAIVLGYGAALVASRWGSGR